MTSGDLKRVADTVAAVRHHVVLGQRKLALQAIDLLSDQVAMMQDAAEAKAKAEAVENFK